MATTIRQELEEEFLSPSARARKPRSRRPGPWSGAVHYVIPTMPAVRVPLACCWSARSRGRRV